MFSYVYMKLLESQPRRYDLGIALLSLGHAGRVRRRLVADSVGEGDRVLEIGTGTGEGALLAAGRGARVLAFDVSAPLLDVAREKVREAGVEDRIELVEMSVSGMDGLEAGSFDVVLATLVFSELSRDERAYALHHAYRVLRSGGRLALAVETRPRRLLPRLLHAVLRAPLAVLTFVLTQTTTRAVEGLPELVRRAGFDIVKEERSRLDSFLTLLAQKAGGP